MYNKRIYVRHGIFKMELIIEEMYRYIHVRTEMCAENIQKLSHQDQNLLILFVLRYP